MKVVFPAIFILAFHQSFGSCGPVKTDERPNYEELNEGEELHDLTSHGHLSTGVKEKRCNDNFLLGSIRNPKPLLMRRDLPSTLKQRQCENCRAMCKIGKCEYCNKICDAVDAKERPPVVGLATRFNPENGLSEAQERYYTLGAFGPGTAQSLIVKLLNIPKNFKLDKLIVLGRNKSEDGDNSMMHPVIIDTAHVFTTSEGTPSELNPELHNVEDYDEDDMLNLTKRLNKELDAAIEAKKKMLGDSHLTPEEIDKIIDHAVGQFKSNKGNGDEIVSSKNPQTESKSNQEKQFLKVTDKAFTSPPIKPQKSEVFEATSENTPMFPKHEIKSHNLQKQEDANDDVLGKKLKHKKKGKGGHYRTPEEDAEENEMFVLNSDKFKAPAELEEEKLGAPLDIELNDNAAEEMDAVKDMKSKELMSKNMEFEDGGEEVEDSDKLHNSEKLEMAVEEEGDILGHKLKHKKKKGGHKGGYGGHYRNNEEIKDGTTLGESIDGDDFVGKSVDDLEATNKDAMQTEDDSEKLGIVAEEGDILGHKLKHKKKKKGKKGGYGGGYGGGGYYRSNEETKDDTILGERINTDAFVGKSEDGLEATNEDTKQSQTLLEEETNPRSAQNYGQKQPPRYTHPEATNGEYGKPPGYKKGYEQYGGDNYEMQQGYGKPSSGYKEDYNKPSGGYKEEASYGENYGKPSYSHGKPMDNYEDNPTKNYYQESHKNPDTYSGGDGYGQNYGGYQGKPATANQGYQKPMGPYENPSSYNKPSQGYGSSNGYKGSENPSGYETPAGGYKGGYEDKGYGTSEGRPSSYHPSDEQSKYETGYGNNKQNYESEGYEKPNEYKEDYKEPSSYSHKAPHSYKGQQQPMYQKEYDNEDSEGYEQSSNEGYEKPQDYGKPSGYESDDHDEYIKKDIPLYAPAAPSDDYESDKSYEPKGQKYGEAVYPIDLKDNLPVYSLVDQQDDYVGAKNPDKATEKVPSILTADYYKQEYNKLKEWIADNIKNGKDVTKSKLNDIALNTINEDINKKAQNVKSDTLKATNSLLNPQTNLKSMVEDVKTVHDDAIGAVDKISKPLIEQQSQNLKSLVKDVKALKDDVIDKAEKFAGLPKPNMETKLKAESPQKEDTVPETNSAADAKLGEKEDETVGCLEDKSEERPMYLRPIMPYNRNSKPNAIADNLEKLLHIGRNSKNTESSNKETKPKLFPGLATLPSLIKMPTLRPRHQKPQAQPEPEAPRFENRNFDIPPQNQQHFQNMPPNFEPQFIPQSRHDMLGDPHHEFSPEMRHFGKIVPQHVHDMRIHNRDVSEQLKGEKMYFVGDGIKLPLHMKKHDDGTLHLTVDVQKLCKCNKTDCTEHGENDEPHFLDTGVDKTDIIEDNRLEENVGAVLPENSQGTSTTEKLISEKTTTQKPTTERAIFGRFPKAYKLPKLGMVKRYAQNSEEYDDVLPIDNLQKKVNSLLKDLKDYENDQYANYEHNLENLQNKENLRTSEDKVPSETGILTNFLSWMKDMAMNGSKVIE